MYLEQEYWKDFKNIVGVDEVGRGAASGELVVAAVMLTPFAELPGVRDSKKMTPRQRERSLPLIYDQCVVYSFASKSPEEVDQLNILRATLRAMKEAVLWIAEQRHVDLVLVDGIPIPELPIPQLAFENGEEQSINIAAASVIAKQKRDRMMIELHHEYPQYNWMKNKGYLTAEHIDAIRRFGITPYHRRSFLRKIIPAS